MKRSFLAVAIAAGTFASPAAPEITAQSGTGSTKPTTPSSEWPTYGHDPGRHAILAADAAHARPTSISSQVAWVYHMRPAPPPDGGAAHGGRARCAGTRARPRRFGLRRERGHAARRRRRDVHRHAVQPRRRARSDDWKRDRGRSSCRRGNPSTRGVEYWPATPRRLPQIVFGTSDGAALFARCQDRRAERKLRRRAASST